MIGWVRMAEEVGRVQLRDTRAKMLAVLCLS